ncbi:hypothetical protein ACTHSJ_17255 [Paenibacillus cellulositrophicus]|uniref:hypothetical protein n=1 Tax=Paenibacillus cellulositrophicus TaxID=562959 RepID=UPI003F80C7E3
MITNGHPYGPCWQPCVDPYAYAYNQRSSYPYALPYTWPQYVYPVPYRTYYAYDTNGQLNSYPYPFAPITPQPFPYDWNRVEPTPQGYKFKINPATEKTELAKPENTAVKPEAAKEAPVKSEAAKSEPVKEKAKKEEPVKSEAAKGEQKAESTKGVQMNTSMEIGGKHGVGVSASGQMDSTGVSTQAGTHVGGESYGLGMQGEAGVSGSHGLNFDTGAQLGGKYGLGVHADGHVGIKQGIGLNTEAQLGGDHGIGAYVNSQVGGGQGAGVSAGAHVGGDHGLGAHAGAQVGGGKGVSFKVGGNVGSHDGELGLNFGGSDKKKS